MSSTHETEADWQSTDRLRRAVLDAERWLARWFREGAEGDAEAVQRDIQYGVVTLGRLIDVRKALSALEEADHARARPNDQPESPGPLDAAILETARRLEPGGADPGDPDAVPS